MHARRSVSYTHLDVYKRQVRGRYLVGNVVDAETGEVLVPTTKMMDAGDAKLLETRHWVQQNIREGDRCEFNPANENERPTVMIRTVLTLSLIHI